MECSRIWSVKISWSITLLCCLLWITTHATSQRSWPSLILNNKKEIQNGQFVLQCLYEFGVHPTANTLQPEDATLYKPFECNTNCSKCKMPNDPGFPHYTTTEECKAGCQQFNGSTPCERGCEFVNHLNTDTAQDGMSFDNRSGALNIRIPLTCRTSNQLLFNIRARILNGKMSREPLGFLLLYRKRDEHDWSVHQCMFENFEFIRFPSGSGQIAVAMVTRRGILVSDTFDKGRLNLSSVIYTSDIHYGLGKESHLVLQPVTEYRNITFQHAVETFTAKFKWKVPSPSKPCEYVFSWRQDEGHDIYGERYSLLSDPTDKPYLELTMPKLTYNTTYVLDIYTKQSTNPFEQVERHTELVFRTPPNCKRVLAPDKEFYKYCAPGSPRNLQIIDRYLGNGTSLVTVSWKPDMFTPLGYSLWWKKTPFSGASFTRPHIGQANVSAQSNNSYEFQVDTGYRYILRVSARFKLGHGKPIEKSFTPEFPPTDPPFFNWTGNVTVLEWKSPEDNGVMYLLVVGVLICIVVPSLGGGKYYHNRRRARDAATIRQQMREEIMEDGVLFGELLVPAPEPDEWEVDHSSIAFGETIGSGAFGSVSKATVIGLPGLPDNKEVVVAVKNLKPMATIEDRRNFLSEMAMMKQLGKHLNIVSMLGCVTQGGQLCLLTEYCPYGDLRNYLRSIRDKAQKHPHFRLGQDMINSKHTPTGRRRCYSSPSKKMRAERQVKKTSKSQRRRSEDLLRNGGCGFLSPLMSRSIKSQSADILRDSSPLSCLCRGACSCNQGSPTLSHASSLGGDYCNEDPRHVLPPGTATLPTSPFGSSEAVLGLSAPLIPSQTSPEYVVPRSNRPATNTPLARVTTKQDTRKDNVYITVTGTDQKAPWPDSGHQHTQQGWVANFDNSTGNPNEGAESSSQELNNNHANVNRGRLGLEEHFYCNSIIGGNDSNRNLPDLLVSTIEKSEKNTGIRQTNGQSDENRRELTQNDLLSIARQIAVGMEYLSQRMFVHRDLAARNILICEDNLVKISDFGLTRDVYESSEYRKLQSTGKLPLKWMAPEAIFQNVHTTKSDVWAYGVVLWEIITLGGSPYPGLSGKEFYKLLKNDHRMGKPDMCSPELYSMMRACWATNPEDRPTFTDLRNRLEQLMDREDEIYIDVNFDDSEYAFLVQDSSSESGLSTTSHEPLVIL